MRNGPQALGFRAIMGRFPVGSIRAECGQGGCVYPGSEGKGQWTYVFAVERFHLTPRHKPLSCVSTMQAVTPNGSACHEQVNSENR